MDNRKGIVPNSDNVVAVFYGKDCFIQPDSQRFSKIDVSGLRRTFFIFSESEIKNTKSSEKVAKISVNNTLYHAVEEIEDNPFEIAKIHGLNIDEIFDSYKLVSEDKRELCQDFVKNFAELRDWQNSLINNCDAYENVCEEEIVKTIIDYYMLNKEIREKFKDEFVHDYCFYEHSKLEDLSFLNGVKRFSWKRMVEFLEGDVYFDYIDKRLGNVSKDFVGYDVYSVQDSLVSRQQHCFKVVKSSNISISQQ